MEKMQTSGPPTTPQRVGQISSLKSTPNSNGTAVTSEHLGIPIVDAVSPALFEDIRNHEKRPVGVVLGAFLALCLDKTKANNNIKPEDLLKKCLKVVLPICNEINSQLRFYLKEYASITSEETKRYKPFVFAFNHALEKLQAAECDELRSPSELNIMFHRNDPKYIIGTHDGGKSSRKPDVNQAGRPFRASGYTWKGFAYKIAGEHPRGNFDWGGIASSQEFKKKKKKIAFTLPESFSSDAPCGIVDPQPLPKPCKDVDGEIRFTEEADELQQRASAEGPAPDSAKPEVFPPQRSARPVSKSAPSSMQQQLHSSSSLMASGGGSSGKRKREEPQESKKMQIYETIVPNLKPIPAMLQSAVYAAERMSYGFWVTHVINLVIVDDVAYVWYYDNENSVQSFGINFIKDLPYFLVLLFAFQRFDSQNWGEMKEFEQVKTNRPRSRIQTMPERKIRGHYGLKGRCTQVLKTTSSSKDPRDRTKSLETVRWSRSLWPQASRTPEAEILETARMAGEKAEHKHIKGHLPDLIYTRDFDQYSTDHIRDLLRMASKGGKRVLRWMVYRKLYPITDLIGGSFGECSGNASVVHNCGKVHNCGILNDLDLAQLRGRLPPSGTERTGTMPFMALDLLRGPAWHGHVEREYRHDAESFAWGGTPSKTFTGPYSARFQTTYKEKLARVRKLDPTYLTPTASYGQKYYNVAVNLLYMYDTRHGIAVKVKPQDDSDSEAEESGADLDRPESKPDESAGIDAELKSGARN
ncbi:hypothetical protein BD779DRAFT_1473240 [Infundibulicybe gibba]|nr:hypothetical protein BD779DRAFT_1473240 [Infundibulicybe gibba]